MNSPTWTAGKNYIGNGRATASWRRCSRSWRSAGNGRGSTRSWCRCGTRRATCCRACGSRTTVQKWVKTAVDNARIWFDHVRVGRGALLDRFGGVGEDGVYGVRSGVPGRGFSRRSARWWAGGSRSHRRGLSAAKSGLAIAVKYAVRRRQFRAPGATGDTALLSYGTHQRRLLPLLANAYALDFMLKDLVRRRVETMGEKSSRRRTTRGRRGLAQSPQSSPRGEKSGRRGKRPKWRGKTKRWKARVGVAGGGG